VVEQIALIAGGALAAAFESTTSPEAAFAAFGETTVRKPSVASLPKGSVPDVVFRYWLAKVAGLPEDAVDLKGMGASQVQQALLASSVDAASILEPVLTIVEQRVPDARVIVRGDEMLPNQPGAVVAVREELLETDRAAVLKLVELHLRATELIEQDPDLAAEHVHAFVGKGLVPVDLLQQAMRSPSSNFVADPNAIIEATRTMHDFQLEAGIIAQPVPLDELFDTSLFDEVKGGG
jgi:NitT/TauT family transport system substrate-binding protein